jgi:hypothetical protein
MYALRISGSNDYVSKINKNDTSCYPPGRVDVVSSFMYWEVKKYATRLGAERAAKLVWKLEGFQCSIENME